MVFDPLLQRYGHAFYTTERSECAWGTFVVKALLWYRKYLEWLPCLHGKLRTISVRTLETSLPLRYSGPRTRYVRTYLRLCGKKTRIDE